MFKHQCSGSGALEPSLTLRSSVSSMFLSPFLSLSQINEYILS